MSDLGSARRKLDAFFDRANLERGYVYALDGRASIRAERRSAQEVEIEAHCQGSRPRPYTQKIVLSFDQEGALDFAEGECSCPMEVDCKHVVCVALAWLTSRAPLRSARAAPSEPEPVYLPPEAEEWLRQFGLAVKRAANGELKGECVCYRLSEDARVIGIVKGRILKGGRLTAFDALTPDLGWLYRGREPPRYVGGLDVPVFEAIARLPRAKAHSGWNLEGSFGAQALEAALATGRLRLAGAREWRTYGPNRDQLPLGGEGWLRCGAPLSGTLELSSDDASAAARVRVVVRGPGAGLAPIPVSPLYYLDAVRGEIGRLEIPGPQLAVAQLLRMPALDASGARLLLPRLRRLALDARMEELAALVPAAIEAPAAPRARLRITRGVFRQFGRGRAPDDARWIAELWFDYPHGLSLPADESEAPGARWRGPDGVERVALRDAQAERVVRQKLAASGCVLRAPHDDPRAYRLDARRMYVWPGDGSEPAWREGAAQLFEAAYDAGVDINCDEGFPLAPRETGEVYQELAPGASGWFELELGIVVDGQRVPLAGAIADWIRRTSDLPGWLKHADARPPVLLKAGPAGLVRLPAERLKRLLEPLLETFAFERAAERDRLRLSRIEAAFLPEAPAADLARLRERLSDFRGIAPASPAPGFAGVLRPYQQSGLDWLQFLREFGLAGILADDMGLGKTVQALAHLDLEKASGRAGRPSLVVAPTSVLPNWREEAARFAPRLRVLVLQGSGRSAGHGRITDADLVLTSYALLARDRAVLAGHEYHLLLFDEAQFLKNAKTQVHAAAAALRARHRLALTGTPIENNLGELWAHFNLLLPGFLGDPRQFARAWRTPIEKEGDGPRMARLARRVKPFILRRTRAEVLDDLPEKTEIVQHVELEGAQRDLYESLRIALDGKLRRAIAAKGIAGTQIEILDALLKLRQACCDPRLVKTPAAKAAYGASAKLESLKEMLAELRAEGRRALVFSQFTSMLDLIEAELPSLGVRQVRLSGDTRDREAPVEAFQAGEADVFLISLRAGGTGLNLTAADTVIHYDPWWNPAVEAQATARAHRIGQDKAVFVFKLIALGTVEERILELRRRKQVLADALLGAGRASAPLITEDDIRALLAPIDSAL